MKLCSIGSGSKGNSFALSEAGETLIVDAGFGPRTTLNRLRKAEFQLGRVSAIALTHEHGDHARGVAPLAEKLACQVVASAGTLRALQGRLNGIKTSVLAPHTPMQIGRFSITGCLTSHDAAEPMALLIAGLDSGVSVAVAYDLGRPTHTLKYLLRRAHCVVIESNHDESMLRTGPYPPVVQERIAGSGGHLSNRAAAQLVSEIVHPGLGHVILAHVSHNCNEPELALSTVRDKLTSRGFDGIVQVAAQDRPSVTFEITNSEAQLEFEQTIKS